MSLEAEIEPLREQLRKVRERLGSRVLLSRLGLALRELDPSFAPASYGALTLGELLRLVPDIGRVEGEQSSKMFVFEGAALASTSPPRLQPHVWKAVTDFRTDAGTWHIDLETFHLRHSGNDPGNLLSIASERFVALPKLGADFQKDLARAFLNENKPEQKDTIEGTLAAGNWTTTFLESLGSGGLVNRWRAQRAARITGEVLAWADRHGIPHDRIVEPPANPIRRTSVSGERMAPDNLLGDMRSLLHDAIEMMSLAELAALPVPPAYLALAASRRRR